VASSCLAASSSPVHGSGQRSRRLSHCHHARLAVCGSLGLSCAFLYGVYGDWGKAATRLSLLVAVGVVTIYGLLPAFQLRWLLRVTWQYSRLSMV